MCCPILILNSRNSGTMRPRRSVRKPKLSETLEFPRWVVAIGVFAIAVMLYVSGHRDAEGNRLPVGPGGWMYFGVAGVAALGVLGRRGSRN